jgi:hypothetical protein
MTMRVSRLLRSAPSDKASIAAFATVIPEGHERSARRNSASRAHARGQESEVLRSLVEPLPERDPVTDADALKIVELTVEQIAAEKASIAVVATMINANARGRGHRPEGHERPARPDLEPSLARACQESQVPAVFHQPEVATPPKTPTITTTSGGSRHTASRTKATKATPKSPGALTELVQSGS